MDNPDPPRTKDEARRAFGQPFVDEPGSTWQPRPVPVLTTWIQARGKQVQRYEERK